jgi:hypothetical protein
MKRDKSKELIEYLEAWVNLVKDRQIHMIDVSRLLRNLEHYTGKKLK